MKRNEKNNPVFELATRLEIERTDNTMHLREIIASGNYGDDSFTCCSVIGGMGFTVEIKRKGGETTRYLIQLQPIVREVLENSAQWDCVATIKPKARSGA